MQKSNRNLGIMVGVLILILACCCVLACLGAIAGGLIFRGNARGLPVVGGTQTVQQSDLGLAWQEDIDGLFAFYAQYPADTNIMDGILPNPALPIMGVFDVLDKIRMQDGWVLDYVYHADGMGSYPILYARPESQAPYRDEVALREAMNACAGVYESDQCPEFMDHVVVDGSPLSYLQLALLATSGDQFYLGWHANYNDTKPIATREALEAVVAELQAETFGKALSTADASRAKRLPTAPWVKITGQTVEIRYLTFSKWGGFYEQNISINPASPYHWNFGEPKPLLPYESGIMF